MLAIFLALVLANAPHAAALAQDPVERAQAINPTNSFESFWDQFRAALLASDAKRIGAMTRFPLETRGESDADPVRHHKRAELPSLLARVMSQDSGLSTAGPLSTRMLAQNDNVLPSQGDRRIQQAADQARVGPFAFARNGKRWQLVRIYMGDE